MPDQAHDTVMKIGTGAADPDHKLIPTNIKAQTITTHTEAAPDHTIGSTEDTIGVVHNAHPPPLMYANPTMIHHIADHLHIEAILLTPEIVVGHTLDQPTHPLEKICTDLLHIPADHKAKCMSHRTLQ